jgi:predicted phage terminase large subunit-like protein
VWYWTQEPSTRVIHGTYSKDLSVTHASLSRRLIESPTFQQTFPEIKLEVGSERKDHYKNTLGGARLSVSVHGATTGYDADLILADDLHSVQERESEAEAQHAVTFYSQTLSSRAVFGKRVPKIVLGQRVGGQDVSQFILDNFKSDPSWSFLVLPMEYDPNKTSLPNAINWQDKRTEEGEILWPEAVTPNKLNAIKREHRHSYACLYNQDPVAQAGNLFKAETFQYHSPSEYGYQLGTKHVQHTDCWRFATVDLAVGTASNNDYTVIGVFDWASGNLILKHLTRARLDGTKIVPTITALYHQHKPQFVVVENVAMQKVIIDQLRQHVPVKAYRPEGDKETRSILAQVLFEDGKVWLPPSCTDLTNELLAFPNGKHDDMVDVLSMAAHIANRYGRQGTKPALSDEEQQAQEDEARRKHMRNLANAGMLFQGH